ncbi:KWG Leptospira [compost metagenome]
MKQNNAAGEALIDRKGNIVTSLTEPFSSDFNFSDGLSVAYAPKSSGLIGYMNTAGKLAIPYNYLSGSRGFSEGLALVRNSAGLYGYINTSGKTVVPFKYKSGGDFSEGLAAVQNTKGKWGFINRKGKVIIPFKYANTGSFSEGLAHVYNDRGKIGFINTKGKLVIGYQKYNSAFPFKEGIALVGISNPSDNTKDKYGYINTKGELLTKLIYSLESSSFSGGYAVGVTDIGTGYILSKRGAVKH